jgi:hypothetical protein
MDIQKVLAEINAVEREKAQLELLTSQLAEQKTELEKRMTEAGVTPETIDAKIAELEGGIAASLKIVREGMGSQAADPIGSLSI